MFGLSALMAKAWFKPAVWLLVIIGVALAFMYALQSYGRSQYDLGRSDKTNEILNAQAQQLTTLIGKVTAWGEDTTANAGKQADRMAALETAANGVIADAKGRVLIVPGPDGKCQPTDDWRNSWNKLNALPNARK